MTVITAIRPLTNPMGPESGLERIIRGGSWSSDIQFLRISNRANHNPIRLTSGNYGQMSSDIGFRCVVDEVDFEDLLEMYPKKSKLSQQQPPPRRIHQNPNRIWHLL